MGSPQETMLTATLLHNYSKAALRNADELLVEATLLLNHGHLARAYFLSVASIEEVGKALLSFDSQKRNLADPAVCSKLRKSLENHGDKISYALAMWAMSHVDQRAALLVAVDLIGDVRHGREPSMYTDFELDRDEVLIPRDVVSPNAAQNCLDLAHNCLANSHRHVNEKTPQAFSNAHDRLFTMKPAKVQDLLKTEDFLWYYISRMEVGQFDFADAVLRYERNHFATGKPFLSPE